MAEAMPSFRYTPGQTEKQTPQWLPVCVGDRFGDREDRDEAGFRLASEERFWDYLPLTPV